MFDIPPPSSLVPSWYTRSLYVVIACVVVTIVAVLIIQYPFKNTVEPTAPVKPREQKIASYDVRNNFYDFYESSRMKDNYMQSITQGESLIKEYPDDFYIHHLTARAYIYNWFKTSDESLLKRAEELLAIALQKKPQGAVELFRDQRVIKALLLKHEEGIDFFQKKISEFPDLAAEFHLHIGSLYDLSGNRTEAKRYLGLAIKGNPNQPDAYFVLARLAVGDAGGPNILAIRQYATKGIEVSTTSPANAGFGYAMLAEAYIFEKNYPQAIQTARKGIAITRSCSGCYHMLGDALLGTYFKQKSPKILEESIQAQEKAVMLAPHATHPYYNLGIGYFLRGEREKAIATWQKGLGYLARDPHYPAWYKPEIEKVLRTALANPDSVLDNAHGL